MSAVGKLQDLGLEILQPGGTFREQDVARLDFGRLGRHAGHLVAFGLDGDRPNDTVAAQVLDQVGQRIASVPTAARAVARIGRRSRRLSW